MRLGIKDFLRRLVGTDNDIEPTQDAELPEEERLPIALCSPYSYPAQWQAELAKPCYCGLEAIWLDFYSGKGGDVTAVGTCQHHRGVKEWRHIDDGPVRAYWSPCHMCPEVDGWGTCFGHIVVGDNLHTIIPPKGQGYALFNTP